MRTISAIYSHCLTSLNDDWLSTSEGPVDIEDAIVRDIERKSDSKNLTFEL